MRTATKMLNCIPAITTPSREAAGVIHVVSFITMLPQCSVIAADINNTCICTKQ